jgi:two-component system phosphate regulon response regulator OmpR
MGSIGRMTAPPARILVIDDDAELRTLLLRYLGENGFDVRVAADAEHADRLLARIQAMLRRQAMLGARPVSASTGLARFGEFELNLATHVLTRNATPVPLTSSEFALLRAFVGNAGRPLSRERLMELAHGRDHEATDRSVDVQVLRLRRLIEPDPARPRYIRTVWGTGYVFVADGAA